MIFSRTLAAMQCAILMALAAVLATAQSPRFATPDEARRLRGGDPVPPCAEKVVDTTDWCFEREVTTKDGAKYYCTGKNYDQACTTAKTNTNKVCDKSEKTCGGSQYVWIGTDPPYWSPMFKPCEHSKYKTAQLKDGQCVPNAEP